MIGDEWRTGVEYEQEQVLGQVASRVDIKIGKALWADKGDREDQQSSHVDQRLANRHAEV